jgi:tetratricopeptide (TPR) repeat protein
MPRVPSLVTVEQTESRTMSVRLKLRARRGSVLWIALASILIVGLAAVSIASTLFAMRSVEQRDRAREDFASSSDAVNEMVLAVANSGKLKGASAAEDREVILQPVVDHYQYIIEKYEGDETMLPQLASAQLHLASVQAKLGLPACSRTLSAGLATLSKMVKSDFSQESYPSFQDTVSRIAAPTDWMTVKDSTPAAQGVALYGSLGAGVVAYRDLSKKFPDAIVFRDDLAELLKSRALLLGFIGRGDVALENWNEATDVLETMVRDEPDNLGFQERLAESLTSEGKLEVTEKQPDKAIADYKRAVEVRQKMAESNPEDKSLEQALTRVKRDLERVETAAAAKKDAPEAAESADATSEKKASDEPAAEEEAPEEETPQQ